MPEKGVRIKSRQAIALIPDSLSRENLSEAKAWVRELVIIATPLLYIYSNPPQLTCEQRRELVSTLGSSKTLQSGKEKCRAQRAEK
jgi:hypothetical protein